LNPEAIAVSISRAVLVSGPVASLVFLQQTLVRELIENLSAKYSVQINRSGLRRPDPKGGAVREQRRAGRRLRRNVLLGKHGLLSLQHGYRRQISTLSASHDQGVSASATTFSANTETSCSERGATRDAIAMHGF